MTKSAEAVLPGPQVNGLPSQVTLYSASQFRKFPYLGQLRVIINESFTHANLPFFKRDRLVTEEQYLDILGDDTFTFTITSETSNTSDAEPTIYAVGSAHAYSGSLSASEAENIWSYVRPVEVDTSRVKEWEMKILAVNKVAKRNGLGAYMLELLENECRRRSEQARKEDAAEQRDVRDNKMVLTTLLETNETFYKRHGYQLDSSRFVDLGFPTLKNWKTFHVASMSKDL